MPLSPEHLQEVALHIRGGFDDRDRVVEAFCEEIYEPGELDPEEVEAAVDAAFARLEAEKAGWPEVTDCDRLDAVFAALRQRGIVALQNAGITQSDGYSDCSEEFASLSAQQRSRVIGYCFYHWQDVEHAVEGRGLFLAFGPVDPKQEKTHGPAVGRVVVEELQKAGFATAWDGTFGARILIPKLDWKRR